MDHDPILVDLHFSLLSLSVLINLRQQFDLQYTMPKLNNNQWINMRLCVKSSEGLAVEEVVLERAR